MPLERIAEVIEGMLAAGILSEEEGILWLGRKGEEEFGRKIS